MTHYFSYKNHELFIEEVALQELAEIYGTPCYVYSANTIRDAYLSYANALGSQPGKICYAVKACSNIAILQTLARLGAGFDIVSQGELERVLIAGGRPENILFSGVGKTAQEMARALQVGIGCFNVESEAELFTLAEVAKSLTTVANISLRVNPDVDANTHPYISTGLKENKFGIDIEQAIPLYEKAQAMPELNIVGVDCHIGSQLTDTAPFLAALDRLIGLIQQLRDHGITLSHLDLGGGLGVRYKDEQPPQPDVYIQQIRDALNQAGLGDALALYFEPGRSIVANAGALVTQVLYLKPTPHKNFAVVDAAMNDNIRPSLYQAWQEVLPLRQSSDERLPWDIVGPICETGDFLAKERSLSLQQGEYVALMSSGAYGFTMSSNYNSRGRCPEVLVDGAAHYQIRRRESIEDLLHHECLLPETGGQP